MTLCRSTKMNYEHTNDVYSPTLRRASMKSSVTMGTESLNISYNTSNKPFCRRNNITAIKYFHFWIVQSTLSIIMLKGALVSLGKNNNFSICTVQSVLQQIYLTTPARHKSPSVWYSFYQSLPSNYSASCMSVGGMKLQRQESCHISEILAAKVNSYELLQTSSPRHT